MSGPPLLWVIADNRKTGSIPSAYVGSTVAEARQSCEGCALRDDGTCYAWHGLNALIFRIQHAPRYERDPDHFDLPDVLGRISPAVRSARLGVLGDPARADREELLGSIEMLRDHDLAVLGYTHFWRDEENQELRPHLMASCDTVPQVDQALSKGWRPATVLPWWHEGNRFITPGGARGLVCPAQTKDKVTCDSCRLCDPSHPVWEAGKIDAIGFVDHSPTARAIRRREENEKTLPLFPS